MRPTKLTRELPDVVSRLESVGLTKAECLTIAHKAASARNESIFIDPISASGQLAYIYGNRALRQALLAKEGWEIDRTDNIESTVNYERGLRIIYQNVERASDPLKGPKAISEKGNGSARIVNAAQILLFPEWEQEKAQSLARLNALDGMAVWYFCVSVEGEYGDDVRVEISRPLSIESKQFKDFDERIFIVQMGEWGSVADAKQDVEDSFDDFEVEVTRK